MYAQNIGQVWYLDCDVTFLSKLSYRLQIKVLLFPRENKWTTFYLLVRKEMSKQCTNVKKKKKGVIVELLWTTYKSLYDAFK